MAALEICDMPRKDAISLLNELRKYSTGHSASMPLVDASQRRSCSEGNLQKCFIREHRAAETIPRAQIRELAGVFLRFFGETRPGFSAVQIVWRREMNSNSRYSFVECLQATTGPRFTRIALARKVQRRKRWHPSR